MSTATAMGLLPAEALFARPAQAATTALPDIQFDTAAFTAPAQTIDGVAVRFGPTYTLFMPAQLRRRPTRADQKRLASMLTSVESAYPFSPRGVFTTVAYGIPYFDKLADRTLVSSMIPRTLADPSRFALEEAVPSPSDVTMGGMVVKPTFNVAVVIEDNDVLLSFRSDSLQVLDDVGRFVRGSGRLRGHRVPEYLDDLLLWETARLMFVQIGLPRTIADTHSLPYAEEINPDSPMWMGFSSQQVAGSGPASITTFAGNDTARFTDAHRGSYFDDGSIQHFSHNILDLGQFYRVPVENFNERCGYMFRSNPLPARETGDGFVDGGGTAFCPNQFRGTGDAASNASGAGTADGGGRIGHLNALQRTSRTPDGKPWHLRMDGTGFDALDVPDGSQQPKLHFSIFVPTADLFTQMRISQASTDLASKFHVRQDEQGIERFLTATRRQNFLVPPRRHRALPLVELLHRA